MSSVVKSHLLVGVKLETMRIRNSAMHTIALWAQTLRSFRIDFSNLKLLVASRTSNCCPSSQGILLLMHPNHQLSNCNQQKKTCGALFFGAPNLFHSNAFGHGKPAEFAGSTAGTLHGIHAQRKLTWHWKNKHQADISPNLKNGDFPSNRHVSFLKGTGTTKKPSQPGIPPTPPFSFSSFRPVFPRSSKSQWVQSLGNLEPSSLTHLDVDDQVAPLRLDWVDSPFGSKC